MPLHGDRSSHDRAARGAAQLSLLRDEALLLRCILPVRPGPESRPRPGGSGVRPVKRPQPDDWIFLGCCADRCGRRRRYAEGLPRRHLPPFDQFLARRLWDPAQLLIVARALSLRARVSR
jgi:hypothetical protein